ncbi:UbiA-like protein EboC [Anthocerotibacter panamensis]|uniref:UbiA-like protein EboC n=1 Tax=Anthocerotibacter panamensis TaxID=2857077 RepID=UPI001C4086CE|nr:UbiA-like protein EboC [Anthocerotibacter panamensis]
MKEAGLRFSAYLQLLRPANTVTALADILAGFAVAGGSGGLGWLLLATVGLYGGGMVWNDVCDAGLDAQERPERPIPSGRASRMGAALLGAGLLALGVGAAGLASGLSAQLALVLALLALGYDRFGKHHPLLGPLNMGACRGLNLLLGVSAVPVQVGRWWFLAWVPLAYIAAITAISHGEVHGGKQQTGVLALGLLGLVLLAVLALTSQQGQLLPTLPMLGLLAGLVLPPFIQAAKQPEPFYIRRAVRAGVLALIVLDAALAACFAGLVYALGVLLLLPISRGLARRFAVT